MADKLGSAKFVALMELVKRAANADENLLLVDLSISSEAGEQFRMLSPAQKVKTIEQLASNAPKVQAVMLDACGLGTLHVEAVAKVLRQNRQLQFFSVENNALNEADLLQLADSVQGHPSLVELRLAEQRSPLSTAVAYRLAEAMEATPSLLKLRLGNLRDEQTRKRVEAAVMGNTERLRQRRQQDPAGVAAAEAEARAWRRLLPGAAPAKPLEGRRTSVVSSGIRHRATLVEGAVSEVLAGGAGKKGADWAEEAVKIAARCTSPPAPLPPRLTSAPQPELRIVLRGPPPLPPLSSFAHVPVRSEPPVQGATEEAGAYLLTGNPGWVRPIGGRDPP